MPKFKNGTNIKTLHTLTVDNIKDNLKILGINTRSNNKNYLLRKYLDKEKKIIFCQKYVRRWLKRYELSDLKSQSRNNIPNLVNQCSLMGEDLQNLPENELYFLYDGNMQCYGFHLPEIWEWCIYYNNKTNPYNTKILDTETLKQIDRLYNKHCNLYKDRIKRETDAEVNYNSRLAKMFLQIESMGCYANMEGYKNFTKGQLFKFYKSLVEDYETIKTVVPQSSHDDLIKAKNKLNMSQFQEAVLKILADIFNDKLYPKDELEERALIFTIHLSKCLFPNNDELENYYLNSLNFLIQQIIQQNTFESIAQNTIVNGNNHTTSQSDSDIYIKIDELLLSDSDE